MATLPGVWCKTVHHESHHFIVNGEAVCKTAKKEKWAVWQLIPSDEQDQTKQCTRCRGNIPQNPPDLREQFREWGRIGGRLGGAKGGASRSPAKVAAVRRNGSKRGSLVEATA